MDNQHTTDIFQSLKKGADEYIKRRNLRLLTNHRKELRNFTRVEASTYLGIDAKTLDKYVSATEIDPHRHNDSQWSIDIDEMYHVRGLLPDTLRKELKFIRSAKQHIQVLVIQNQKGGVGKTVSAATVASGLATEFHQPS